MYNFILFLLSTTHVPLTASNVPNVLDALPQILTKLNALSNINDIHVTSCCRRIIKDGWRHPYFDVVAPPCCFNANPTVFGSIHHGVFPLVIVGIETGTVVVFQRTNCFGLEADWSGWCGLVGRMHDQCIGRHSYRKNTVEDGTAIERLIKFPRMCPWGWWIQ